MAAPTQNLRRLPGGLRLPPNKSMSTTADIVDVPVPEILVIPLLQHAGENTRATVGPGDRVQRGQPVGVSAGALSAAVHASSSGIVQSIERRRIPGRGEPSVNCVVIHTDGEDSPWPGCKPFADALSMDRATLLREIERGGIVGLGGAAYPTAAKLTTGIGSGVDGLILNGVECESYISCDDRLMREHAASILRGAVILLHLTETPHCIVALESDKPDAWNALRSALTALRDPRIELVQVPTVYPSGGEDQLVLLLTGKEVPSGGLPIDAGFLVHNVGTAYAVARLVDAGEPLIARIITVTGEGINRPGNYRVRLGTPIADVVNAAGGYNQRALRLIQGGPMTGIALTDDAYPVIKATNCLLITGAAVHLSPEPRRPCIRCGECAEHCPVRLMPQQLLRYAPSADVRGLAMYGLDDCIECGCCDLVCPSHIPLTQIFREAKSALRIQQHERDRAERARERFEAHADRSISRQREQDEILSIKRQAADSDAIRAIVERARKDHRD